MFSREPDIKVDKPWREFKLELKEFIRKDYNKRRPLGRVADSLPY